jgi:hypothetical protein
VVAEPPPTQQHQQAQEPDNEGRRGKPGLPLRWAVIAILAAGGGAVGFMFGGPVAAVTTAVAVAVGAHQLLA